MKNEQSRASRSAASLRRITPRAISASAQGVPLAGGERAEHVPAGDAVDVADHR